jgi:hypothetical protein
MPKISELAAQPQLKELVLDAEEIVKEYGEPVKIWTWDRQPLSTFVRLATTDASDYAAMVDTLKDLILDESGEPVLREGRVLPPMILVASMNAITTQMGK